MLCIDRLCYRGFKSGYYLILSCVSLYMYDSLFLIQRLKTHPLSLLGYCARSRNRRYWFSTLQFFNSAATFEFAMICKLVNRSWWQLVNLMQNIIAVYCKAKFQNVQVMNAKLYDNTNILKQFIRFSRFI